MTLIIQIFYHNQKQLTNKKDSYSFRVLGKSKNLFITKNPQIPEKSIHLNQFSTKKYCYLSTSLI